MCGLVEMARGIAMTNDETTTAIFKELRSLSRTTGKINGRLDVIDEKLNHIPTDMQMIDYVDVQLKKCNSLHCNDREISQVIDMATHRTAEASRDSTGETSGSI